MTDPKNTAVAEPTEDRPEVEQLEGPIAEADFEDVDTEEDDEDDDA